MRLVDDQQRAGTPCDLAYGVVISGLWEDDADVRQRRLDQQRGNLPVGERSFERLDVIERHYPGRLRRIDWGSEVAPAGFDASVVGQPGERLVDRSVVVEVVNGDERPVGDRPGEADRESVGIGRRDRELPVAKAKPPLQLLTDPGGIFGRQHVGDAARQLPLDGGDRRPGAVTGHGARVAETEVDVVMAVDAREVRTARPIHERRISAGPLHHPVHGNAGKQ